MPLLVLILKTAKDGNFTVPLGTLGNLPQCCVVLLGFVVVVLFVVCVFWVGWFVCFSWCPNDQLVALAHTYLAYHYLREFNFEGQLQMTTKSSRSSIWSHWQQLFMEHAKV